MEEVTSEFYYVGSILVLAVRDEDSVAVYRRYGLEQLQAAGEATLSANQQGSSSAQSALALKFSLLWVR